MSLIPAGYLPKFILGVGLLNVSSAVSCFMNPSGIYGLFNQVGTSASPAMTGLFARTFGTLNLISAAVRISAAYNIRNQDLYTLALTTFAISGAVYTAEAFVWKSAYSNFGMVRVGGLVVGAVWMLAEWGGW